MKFYELDEQDLKIFLNAIPYKVLQDPFLKSNKLKNEVKGFRIEKIPHSQLILVSYTIIKRKKDSAFISYIDDFYGTFIEGIGDNKKEMMKKGYSEKEAETLVIADSANAKFRPVLYKLEEYSLEKIEYIESRIEENKFFNIRVDEKINANNEKFEETIKLYESKIQELNESLKKQDKTINELQSRLSLVDSNISTLKNDIKNLETSIHKSNSKELEESMNSVKKSIDSLSEKMTKANNEIKNQISDKKDYEDLHKRIEELENMFLENADNISKSKNTNSEKISIELLSNENFDIMEDSSTLKDDIGDAIFNYVSNDLFDTFREFIIESLYASKPIIADKNNSLKLAKIYSTILTGGNINIISVNAKDINILDLTNKIKSIAANNSVILLKGYFGCYDLLRLSDVMQESMNSILIIEANYSKEFKFLPIETILDFIVFDYKLKEGKIDYFYKYNLGDRASITNSKLDIALASIGYSFKGYEIYNVKFEGVLAFSFIPFIARLNDADIETLINQISDPDIRKKCEAIGYE